MNDLQSVLFELKNLCGQIRQLERKSTYDIYEDLSDLKINYNDPDQLMLFRELQPVIEDLSNARKIVTYLCSPIIATDTLHKHRNGRYEAFGAEYTGGDCVEVLVKDDYEDRYYWSLTRIEYSENDYYVLSASNLSLEGMRIRKRRVE